jgi:hypothetical protein
MKEVRPSTWIILGVLVLIIFAPMFFINVEEIEPSPRPPVDNGLRPLVPDKPAQPQNRPEPPANQPEQPPENQPEGNSPDAPPTE